MQGTEITKVEMLSFGKSVALSIAFILVGIVLVVWGVIINISHAQKSSVFVETEATVVDYRENNDGLYAIVAEYKVGNSTYRKISDTYSSTPQSIGSSVMVKYDPDSPEDAIWTFDSGNIAVPAFGGLFAVAGIFMLVLAIKNKDKINSEVSGQQDAQETSMQSMRQSALNGLPISNGQPVQNGQPVSNGQLVQNGQSMQNGQSVQNGQSMPNDQSAPDGQSVPPVSV